MDRTNELTYMGNKMIKEEHAWKPGECWFFDKNDDKHTINAIGNWGEALFNNRLIYRFVICNFFD